jgi:phosphomannomutase
VRAEEYRRSATESAFDACGMLKRAPEVPPLDGAAEQAYLRRYVEYFRRGGLSGLRILVYQHSAVGRDILPRILRELGADVVTAGRSETFIPIDTENITDEQLKRLEELAVAAETGGPPISAIVSTDGDSDRPLVTAVLPAAEVAPGARRVRFLPGDLLGVVVAEYLRADAAAVPISANDAVERRLGERRIMLAKTQIGSPYVVAALDDLRATAKRQRIVGWEANGGFLTGSDIELNGATLTALPTRDALLPILANLFAAAEQGLNLAALWDCLPARFGRAGLLDDFPVAVSRAILAQLIPAGAAVEVEFDHSNGVVDCSRADGSRTPLDGSVAKDWQRCRAMLTRFFTPDLGFDAIARINVLDGVRVYFLNGDIAHIRPSGNAPQLRIYAVSGSQTRADRIVEVALGEPDGILRRLERAFA